MKFSEREIKDLFIAWVLVSVAFAIALRTTFSTGWVNQLWMSLATVGVAFVVHELAHKFVAQYYRKFAEFRANIPLLFGSILLAFTGLLLAAPGAVMISGFVSKRQSGVISLAGPLANFALAIIVLPFFILVQGSQVVTAVLGYGFLINAWLGFFNLIPFGMFDGHKILQWDKKVYAGMVVLGFVLLAFGLTVQ